jgi:murein DD-endopeptidase MepM/ murein hydrolase activator NlpD
VAHHRESSNRRLSGLRMRFAIALIAVAALVVVGMTSRPDRSGAPQPATGNATAAAAEEPEPRLGADVPLPDTAVADAGDSEKFSARASRQELPPASGASPGPAGQELPQDILEENARIRRDLDHLKRLEAERARVARTLAKAGAGFDGPLRLGASGMAWPVSGPVVSPFGQRWGRLHAGIDIASPAGTVIRAAADGKVVIAGPTGGYGNYVCVQHTNTLNSCYAHMSRFLTASGALVAQGQPIGLVGCTGHCFGDHLHFETWVEGTPVDPMAYLQP